MRVRRWSAVLVMVLVATTACGHGGPSAGSPPSSAAPSTSASGSSATTSATGVSTSTQTLEQSLAAAGVATVADETSTTPAVPVTGFTVFTMTAWQVTSMSEEISDGDGIVGSDLDAALPMPAHTPQMSDIVGGWVLANQDADATTAGALLGKPDWNQPQDVVFPTAVLTLFAADALQHVAAASPSGATSTSPTASATGADDHSGPLVAQDASIVDAPCSTVAGFVDQTLDRVFSLLKLDPAQVASFVNGLVGGGVLGTIAGGLAGFFSGFWNHAVDLAHLAAQTIISQLTAPVLNAIAVAIGGVAVFSMLRSYLKPWKAGVTPTPTMNEFPAVPYQNHGEFKVSVDRDQEIEEWPSQLVDCAKAANVTLPGTSTEGSPVTWTVVQEHPGVVFPSALKGKLDADYTHTLTYLTGNESKKVHASKRIIPEKVTATAEVRRPEIEQLRTFITAYLTGRVPHVVASVVNPILSSYIEDATHFLDHLTAITGTSTIIVEHHGPLTCDEDGTAVPVGDFTANLSATIKTALHVEGHLAGHGVFKVAGDLNVDSDGTGVTGTLTLTGPSSSAVGANGFYAFDHGAGAILGEISGAANNPEVSGSLDGHEEIKGHVHGGFHAGLHLTSNTCTTISGNLVPFFKDLLGPAKQYLTVSGDGDWTAKLDASADASASVSAQATATASPASP